MKFTGTMSEKHPLPPVTYNFFVFSTMSIFIIELAHTFLQHRYRVIEWIRVIEIISMIFICYITETNLTSIGLNGSRMISGIKKGLIWSMGVGVVVFLGGGILFLFGINAFKLIRIPIPPSLDQQIKFFLLIGLIGPVAEEIFFRGILYGFLKQWGIPIASVTSIFIFVMFHTTQHFPITQLIGGMLFTISYEKEKNLFTPIIIHMTGNLAMTIISLLVW